MKIFSKIKITVPLAIMLVMTAYGGFLKEASLFLGIMLWHELGHILMMLITKTPIKSIKITLIGGIVDFELPEQLAKQLLINLGGILNNLILLFCLLIFRLDTEWPLINYFNCLMLIFNLLPIAPLDGFRILKMGLESIYEEEYASHCLFYTGMIALFFLTFIVYCYQSPAGFILCAFLVYQQIMSLRTAKVQRIRQFHNFHYFRRYS